MKHLFFIFITLLAFSCNSIKHENQNNTGYFEGVITYEIDYEPYNKHITPDLLKDQIGEKMILTFKDGNYKKEYFAPNGKLLGVRVLNLQENKMYLRSHDRDTTFWFDIRKADTKTNFSRGNDTIIFNHPAVVIETTSSVKSSELPDKVYEISDKTYFSKKLKVNPNWYKNFKEASFDEIIAVGKGIRIFEVNKGIYWIRTTKAIDIKEKSINKETLKIKLDSTTILKEI